MQTQFHIDVKIFRLEISCKYTKNYTVIFFILRTIRQYLLTAKIGVTDTFIHQFVHCTFLLAMAVLVRKAFAVDVGRMQQQRHHMTAHCL